MPRGPRLDAPGVLHHVMARGIERCEIFHDDYDRMRFLARLAYLAVETETPIYAWCLIPNHFHLLLRSGAAPLSTLMRRLLTPYSVDFNRRHRRSGHLFQNRFKSIVVEEEPYFLELVRYIHLNPVRARIVADVESLATYPWTGHATLIGRTAQLGQDIEFVLRQFGPDLPSAREAYVEFVGAGVALGRRSDLSGGGLRRSLKRWLPRSELARGRESWAFDERILGSSEFVIRTIEEMQVETAVPLDSTLDGLLSRVCCHYDVGIPEIHSGSRRTPVVLARTVIAYLAIRKLGQTPAAVGRFLGISRRSAARSFERAQQLGLDRDVRIAPLLE